jgi:hypothetical protein
MPFKLMIRMSMIKVIVRVFPVLVTQYDANGFAEQGMDNGGDGGGDYGGDGGDMGGDF